MCGEGGDEREEAVLDAHRHVVKVHVSSVALRTYTGVHVGGCRERAEPAHPRACVGLSHHTPGRRAGRSARHLRVEENEVEGRQRRQDSEGDLAGRDQMGHRVIRMLHLGKHDGRPGIP